jgi:hypothetical protein
MRNARAQSGFPLNGDSIIAYRSPTIMREGEKEEFSFCGWTVDDPLPEFQDHVSGHKLTHPAIEKTMTRNQEDLPFSYPNNPVFGPSSVVKVHKPPKFKGQMGEGNGSESGKDHEVDGVLDNQDDLDQTLGRTRLSREKEKRPKKQNEIPKRKPVNQRWYYEPVPQLAVDTCITDETDSMAIELPLPVPDKSGPTGKVSDDIGLGGDLEYEALLENAILKANDKYEFAVAMEEICVTRPEGVGNVVPVEKATFQEIADDEIGASKLQGLLFYDDDLQWCRVNGWGVEHGITLVYYSSVSSENPVDDEHHMSLAELLALLNETTILPVYPRYEPSRTLCRPNQKLLQCYRQLGYEAKYDLPSIGVSTVRQYGAKMGSYDGHIMSDRTIRRILRAQETIFKYGTLIPRNDAEASRSPEAKRWQSGKQLEWLRLQQAVTFENQWTWEKVKLAYPNYKRSDIGHMFFIYDYKFSGEHRVRLVFDGSRQSEATYNNTYAPTVRPESVRLFHVYAVEYSWIIKQYDVPQAFLRSKADCDIFVHPPNGFSEFPGQLLKLAKMLYGSKQAAHLWYNLLNDFLLEIGFTSSQMDPCFYRRITPTGDIDALIILHVDDMRVAAADIVIQGIHTQLFEKFDITTSDTGRFLGMDTDYNMESGILRMHMATYIKNTVDRFHDFDVSHGIPYREIVGSLLWITLNVMGPELLRVKDLARRSNHFTADDYSDALKVLERVKDRMEFGIIYRRGGAGKEIVPRNNRLGGDLDNEVLLLVTGNSSESYSTGDSTDMNELKECDLYKLDEHDDPSLEIPKILAPTNQRFTKVAYSDASFAATISKQSISGLVVMINGTPILWASIKQTVVVDSTCSSEYVAASMCSKQVIQVENMVQFLNFTCPKPYTMYTDSQACLQIANAASKLGKVRHIEIRYHLVRCLIIAGDIKLVYCVTEDMIADLFTKIVSGTQDKRLAVRFYNDCNTLLFVEAD